MRETPPGSDDTLNAPDAADWLEAARAGDFPRAWTLRDRIQRRTSRFGDPAAPRHRQQIWTGASTVGRRVLVRCYHGLGDTIQFARYLPRLRAQARAVSVWAQPSLIPLLRTLDADVLFFPLHDGLPYAPFDVDLEIMELAHLFRSELHTIPAAVPYLSAPAAALRASGRPRIGLAWRTADWDEHRSIPFALLQPLLDELSVDWYSLQLEATGAEHHWNLKPHPGTTPLATASQMRALDLVIAVDSVPAHLAGALAIPVWTILPHLADWRWLVDTARTPWYPTMELFRAPGPGAWAPVIQRVLARVRSGDLPPARRSAVQAGA